MTLVFQHRRRPLFYSHFRKGNIYRIKLYFLVINYIAPKYQIKTQKMKKLILLASLTLIIFFSANAQTGFKFGGSYGFEIEKMGLQFGGQYGVTPKVDVAGGLTFFFPDKYTIAGEEHKTSFWMIDIDGHYNFGVADGLTAYPLAGLNFTTSKEKGGGNSDSHTEFGVNIGAGAQFRLADPLAAFLELKYILGDADQGVLGFGIYYTL